jgi:hypothetical protein
LPVTREQYREARGRAHLFESRKKRRRLTVTNHIGLDCSVPTPIRRSRLSNRGLTRSGSSLGSHLAKQARDRDLSGYAFSKESRSGNEILREPFYFVADDESRCLCPDLALRLSNTVPDCSYSSRICRPLGPPARWSRFVAREQHQGKEKSRAMLRWPDNVRVWVQQSRAVVRV